MNAIGDPDDFYTLHHGARRHITTGIVIHSTRGGAPTPAQEFDGTLNWFARSSSKVSAHAVISLEGLVAWVLPHQYAAYHAKSYNRTHLGVELVQQTPDTPFSDAQYLALAELISHWQSIYGELELTGHDQVDPQKSDPGHLFDWTKLAFLLAPIVGGGEMPEYPNLPKVVTRAETALHQLWAISEGIAAAGMSSTAEEMQRKLVELKRVLGLQEEE